MPSWIHDRAQHLMAQNPGMKPGMAWGVATQQAYASGNAPAGYGTREGRQKAKQKYNGRKGQYEQKADPRSKHKSASIDLDLLRGFTSELEKIALSSPFGLADMNKRVAAKRRELAPASPAPVDAVIPPPASAAWAT